MRSPLIHLPVTEVYRTALWPSLPTALLNNLSLLKVFIKQSTPDIGYFSRIIHIFLLSAALLQIAFLFQFPFQLVSPASSTSRSLLQTPTQSVSPLIKSSSSNSSLIPMCPVLQCRCPLLNVQKADQLQDLNRWAKQVWETQLSSSLRV